MISMETMQSLCNPESIREMTQRPWKLASDGVLWTLATNGAAALVVRGDIGCPAAPSEPWHAFPTSWTHSARYADLAAFFRCGTDPVSCRECHGTGSKGGDYPECEWCGGDGQYAPDPDWVTVGPQDVTVDRRLVWRYLRHVHADIVTLSWPLVRPADHRAAPFAIADALDSWRIFVMPARAGGAALEWLPRGSYEPLQGRAA